ncbi:hydroxymethylpyrimidine/phosphomethylpyrimidine kinase [Myroides sp. DF42-4-2]|uniref:hydroxymethylpyrimidine/phosphomethylpyrimidine kinase n=1 Tax=unclassified Myroides TaxID=2642485 RepID=UPI002578CB85|nr:hydroxymethylpyrimidine/phosphomethylpyrimidine kinase [Myroides sp. DF42-4-2]MDM1407167.1 hydroxymethylpyrimidine/phosphomethylpyrimidine kinase [Myroides sp. DF42-4-2]
MLPTRPIAFSIAGFDPCAGAGLLADCKTFEANQVYGIGILTANTIQTEDSFTALHWEEGDTVRQQLEVLLQRYSPRVIKIGIVQSGEELLTYLELIQRYAPTAFVVWDPVLRSSTHFNLTSPIEENMLWAILEQIDLITPNYPEIDLLVAGTAPPIAKAKYLSTACAVLLKGGHHPHLKGQDQLFTATAHHVFYPQQIYYTTKHGTGCILSSAIASYVALDYPLFSAIAKAKQYIEKTIGSTSTLLAYHV